MALTDKLYPKRDDSPTVRDALVAILAVERRSVAEAKRDAALRKQVTSLRNAVDRNADAAEIRHLLNNLDATIQIVVDPEV